MTAVMNQKFSRAYIKSLQDKVMKRVKNFNKKITTEEIVEIIYQLLPAKNNYECTLSDAISIININQQKIIDKQCEITYLKRKIQLEDQLTCSFLKNFAKENSTNHIQAVSKTNMKKQSSFSLNPSICKYDGSRILTRDSLFQDSIFDKSPNCTTLNNEEQQVSRYGACNTSRSKYSPIKFRVSQYQQTEAQQRQKVKALAKLRKLEKYVFQKQNVHKDKSLNKPWNCGVSPSKLRYKQQNQNLKAIQSNLVTHLSIMQKYRQVPSVQNLVSKEEQLKRKQRQLKQLSQILQKKQISLNQKHADFLKRQKSQKIL